MLAQAAAPDCAATSRCATMSMLGTMLTEEVFTTPDNGRAVGTLVAIRPFSYSVE